MQTFLPYADFVQSAKCLDRNRCGKQRVECLEILVIHSGKKPAWMSDKWYARCMQHKNHPAVKMWEGYTDRLVEYAYAVCNEWTRRGYVDTCLVKIGELLLASSDEGVGRTPAFIGNEAFHASHRSNLLRKNPKHYGQFGWTESDSLEYVWPV